MWFRVVVVIFLEKIFALLSTSPSATNIQSNQTATSPNGSLIGNEMWLMGITVKTKNVEDTHHCLGINIWYTGKVLTTCSCLAKAHDGRVSPYPESQASVFWNPAFLGWGERPVYSKKFVLSAHCYPRKQLPLPWSSDLAVVDTRSFIDLTVYARGLDVDLPSAGCVVETEDRNNEPSSDENLSSWSPKICSEELYWRIRQAQLEGNLCSTYITEGENNQLMVKEIQIVPWHVCDRLVCDLYPDLCDISFEITGILCTTRPPAFNSCLPLGSPLICGQAVLGLYSRPQGSKLSCNQTFPVLMYSTLERVTTTYHNFLSSKDTNRICERSKQCPMSGCAAILPHSIIVLTILTILTKYLYIVR